MIKITKPEISIITRKPIEESDLLRDKSFITYNVDEITKVTLEDDDSGDEPFLSRNALISPFIWRRAL